MKSSLGTYLRDHQAGAVHAIELLEAIEAGYKGKTIGEFATSLLVDIRSDREVLRDIASRVDARGAGLKGIGAHLSERASRIKLRRGGSYGLGLFESLEFLELGIRGKWALWRALAAVAPVDGRLAGFDFEQLATRAEDQQARVEKHRLGLAQTALSDHGAAIRVRTRSTVQIAFFSLSALIAIALLSFAASERLSNDDDRDSKINN